MLIDKFINNITDNRRRKEQKIERVNDKLRNVKYDIPFHEKLLKLDAYTYNDKLGFEDAMFHVDSYKEIDPTQLLLYRFSIPYMTEKLLVTLENKSKKTKKPKSELIEYLKNVYLSSGDIKTKENKSIIKKTFFLFGYDQIRLQMYRNAIQSKTRIIELYEMYPEVDDFLIKKIGLSLEKIVYLNLSLYTYIMSRKKIKALYDKEELINFMTKVNNLKKKRD